MNEKPLNGTERNDVDAVREARRAEVEARMDSMMRRLSEQLAKQDEKKRSDSHE